MTTRYTKTHEWVRLEGDIATVGITAHAADELGELVFAEGKDEGTEVTSGDAVAVVESVKAASDIYAPVGGIIKEFNTNLSDDPTLINKDPENEGWIIKLKVADSEELDALLSAEQYAAL
ncbi:glycine cleavage system protein GcvH [Aristophania vespae]|uniref:Glycine cleavage system H protein n=1 Tax=Aristophania vespae TaxID=2697033 RepID=A0A6P1NC74_9PROT|nr:glycine cleavage system protein GcvH [Aristophania vespae]QHI96275.1 glycine cleavage system protein GcvH [Aristophania vespae]UMM64082.1 Glycine cleavage system H protein [Aristophania vespae]